MSAVPELPYIDTIEQAEAMGKALHHIRRSTSEWAPKLFSGSVAPYLNGKKVLNEELRSMWNEFMTPAERVALITAYVEERMKR